MKTLVGSVTWLPEGFPGRERIIASHFDSLYKTNLPFDLMIVDNDSCHNVKRIVARQDTIETVYNATNEGWATARNCIIEYGMLNGYDIIALFDCDIGVITEGWLEQYVNFFSSTGQAYCGGRPDPWQIKRTIIYKGIEIDQFTEHLGAVNVMHRKCVEIVGGYNNVDLPCKWGLHDCEYGRRLRKSGVLDWCPLYPALSAVRFDIGDDGDYNRDQQPKHAGYIKGYLSVFRRMEQQIKNGSRSVYFPYGNDSNNNSVQQA